MHAVPGLLSQLQTQHLDYEKLDGVKGQVIVNLPESKDALRT